MNNGLTILLSNERETNLVKLTRKAIKRINSLKLDNITHQISVSDPMKYETY